MGNWGHLKLAFRCLGYSNAVCIHLYFIFKSISRSTSHLLTSVNLWWFQMESVFRYLFIRGNSMFLIDCGSCETDHTVTVKSFLLHYPAVLFVSLHQQWSCGRLNKELFVLVRWKSDVWMNILVWYWLLELAHFFKKQIRFHSILCLSKILSCTRFYVSLPFLI